MTTDPREDCLFCKVATGVTNQIIWESATLAAFRNIHPQAPTHLLIVPKRHIPSLAEAGEEDAEWLGELFLAAKTLAEQEGIAEKGYRTVLNIRSHGGQTVDHLHLHVVGGQQLGPNIA